MSEDCTHDCSSCSKSCSDRDPKSFLEQPHNLTKVKKIIGVVSGKGGVGKSLVTGLSAVMMQRAGYKVAVLDADITGPSIPKLFGLHTRAEGSDLGLFPVTTETGIAVMSLNLLTENETDPVVWRGPVIAGTVKQFWTDVIWGDIDFMFIDMPPGTGDVPLTVFQSVPVDGIIVVTSPQELVSMIVEKALNMASLMHIPVLGIVENMSFVRCPDCGKEIRVFGESHVDSVASAHSIEVLAKLPMEPGLAASCDAGKIEFYDSVPLDTLTDKLSKMILF